MRSRRARRLSSARNLVKSSGPDTQIPVERYPR
jgi:hypothetical protein